ncbi:MAG: Chemotaxis response regulator protein-glutamate methylesterase [candidate division BRC1 bacterium ADurb.BinA364]|nr:MAG: Chemotaxis response regulator protein-glutamate methylesterase [candidate division BRC1 bacterium ADurb.BinA364]
MGLHALIVDDTVTYRKILADVCSAMPPIASVATAPSGDLALRKLAQNPYQLVLLDLEMPGLDGIETLQRIRRDHPGVDVVMVSGATAQAASATVKALELGALDFIPKPEGKGPAESVEQLRQQLLPVLRAAETRRLAGRPIAAGDFASSTAAASFPVEPSRPSLARPSAPSGPFAVLAIGVSTGGPKALAQLIPALPGDFPLPVVLVQHMPPMFTAALARDLDKKSALEVKEAAEGDAVESGRVLIAPGGRHMVVRPGAGGANSIGLNDGPPENSCRPSVDVLFRSVANAFADAAALAVIMTGMGADGRRGVEALKRKQCLCLTQSAASCVVYGMPQAVDEAGLSDESCDLNALAGRIVEIVKKSGARR